MNPDDIALTPELAGVLNQYLDVQKREQALREEKNALQDLLAGLMSQRQASLWFPEVDGRRLKVRYKETVLVEYDEARLRERLGERFGLLLAPDIKKIRQCLPELAPLLVPVLDKVGSPSPEKVREALERGLVQKEDFSGAFKKTVRRVVAVMRAGPQDHEMNRNQP